MTCAICGRSSCTRSFHSLEEQDLHDELSAMDERQLWGEIADLRNQVAELKEQVSSLESQQP